MGEESNKGLMNGTGAVIQKTNYLVETLRRTILDVVSMKVMVRVKCPALRLRVSPIR